MRDVGGAKRGLCGSLLAATILCGCTVSKDGLGFASRHGVPLQPHLVVVGTKGPLHSLSVKQRDELQAADAKLQDQPSGWASIQTSGIPLAGSWRIRALVPATLSQDLGFAPAAGSSVFGATGDLVAATSDRDGMVWMERVLCRRGDGYRECARKYQIGVFDLNTGQELARDRKPKTGGALVDVTSYVSLAADPAPHTASELDPRALNRCDGCKGSLPGSTQSVVPVP
jgi:hypothetical protein